MVQWFAPEEVGGTVNEDKDYLCYRQKMVAQNPSNTGTAESILGTIGAMLLTAVGYFYKEEMF